MKHPRLSYCIKREKIKPPKPQPEPISEPYIILRGTSEEWSHNSYEMVICNTDGYIDVEDTFEKIIVDGIEQSNKSNQITFSDTEPTQHEIKFKLTGNTLPAHCFSEIYVGEDYIITVPNTVTTIEEDAFSEGDVLKNVVLPDSIIFIGVRAFASDENLESVTIEATIPPQLGKYPRSDEYDQFNNTTCTIYVPAASVNAYKVTTGWSYYADRIQAIPQN